VGWLQGFAHLVEHVILRPRVICQHQGLDQISQPITKWKSMLCGQIARFGRFEGLDIWIAEDEEFANIGRVTPHRHFSGLAWAVRPAQRAGYFNPDCILAHPLHQFTQDDVGRFEDGLGQVIVVRCRVGPIRALGLETGLVKDPRIQVNGRTIEFPAELKSGSWIECSSPTDCAIYDRTGESMGKVTPRGDWPRLEAGVTMLEFSCDSGSGPAPRARVTTFILGDQL
jgi:hypothetical protein